MTEQQPGGHKNPKVRSIHDLKDAHHTCFDNSLPPVLTVQPGETVRVTCMEATGGQIAPGDGAEVASQLDFGRIHTITGPIEIDGAEPGDVLEVELLDFEHEGWAWTGVFPGMGVLSEDFGDEWGLTTWKVGTDGRAELAKGVSIPLEPFCGVMGVASSTPGSLITMPPRHIGGNVDIRHLIKGSSLFLPVEVAGALFSIGDGHLAQGDGEVCGTALEAPVVVTIRLDVHKGRSIRFPQYQTSGPVTSEFDSKGYFATTGIGEDMFKAAQEALRDMVEVVENRLGLDRMQSYMLCSAVGDMKFAVPRLGDGHAACMTFNMPRLVLEG